MSGWTVSLRDCLAQARAGVLVTVVSAEGSTPRGAGTKMLVTAESIAGTIGGGHLEYKAIASARALLGAGEAAPAAHFERFPLGPSLGQCCGGQVILLFEPFPACSAVPSWLTTLDDSLARREAAILVTHVADDAEPAESKTAKLVVTATDMHGALPDDAVTEKALRLARARLDAKRCVLEADAGFVIQPLAKAKPGQDAPFGARSLIVEPVAPADFHVVLFGAGHVGRALVTILGGLPCRVTWVDSREQEFPAAVPPNVTVEVSDAPEYDVDGAPRDAFYLIMTHSHQLDLTLVERVLRRDDVGYLGLIGSKSKRARFEARLRRKGFGEDALQRITCPIGVPGITGKTPGEIAVAVAAEILRLREAAVQAPAAGARDASLSA